MKYLKKTSGVILVGVLVFGSIGVLLLGGIIGWIGANIRASRHFALEEQAFQIAEAGIEYYRWHLAHATTDFEDGTGAPGPYAHDYFNKEGEKIGEFELIVTPPPVGSTVVTIRSKGTILSDADVDRSIEVQMAIPSLAKYAVAANSDMRFGTGTEVFGQIHSNDGIRFDGLAHNIVASARETYDDDDSDACTEDSWAVHTCINPDDPEPMTPFPQRVDVFEVGRELGVPAIDFDGFTADLSDIKADAQANGRYFASSSGLGYNVVLQINDTFNLYRVNSLVNAPSGCTNSLNQSGWGTWSINSQTLLGNYAFPANGLIFLEDHVWVEGTISGARITIASGRFPESSSTNKSITVNKDLTYTNYDGSDVVALIAQQNINVGMVSDTDLQIDAALVAKNGRAGRYYYRSPGGGSNRCSPYHERDELTLFGMIATNQRYGFAYTDGTGYETRNITYDANLLYGPPPSFPLTSDQYETISWREIDD